jgi:hypothetical protein
MNSLTGRRRVLLAASFVAVGTLVSCAVDKSSNPLSPTIAGPIPGVNITAPRAITPNSGQKIAFDEQPISLVIDNAETSGVRPLNYVFEVAVDAEFRNKVFIREGVSPGNGRTTVQLADALATDRSYYWRARAQDGANTGPYSPATFFSVFTPIVIGRPIPAAPVGGINVNTARPRFTFANASRSGPVGAISYVIEVSETEVFAGILAAWTVAEQSNQTALDAPSDLPDDKYLFWRVRGYDATTVGPWSDTQVFHTPPVVIGPPPGGGGGGGPAPNDALDLRLATVYNSPADIASWPATARISRVTMRNPEGLSFEFSTQNSWPNYTPPGWKGPLQYTVWAVVRVGGQWYTAGFIQMWRGRPSTGAPILAEFARNWAYDGRWGPMNGHQPQVGEQMGFFLSAGDARGQRGVTSVRERSNVVLVSLPPGDTGVFPF